MDLLRGILLHGGAEAVQGLPVTLDARNQLRRRAADAPREEDRARELPIHGTVPFDEE